MKLRLLIATAAAAIVSGSLHAAEPRHAAGVSPGFVQLDSNVDGTLDRDEVRVDPGLGAHWRDLDRNHDGAVSGSEFSAFESGNGIQDQPPCTDSSSAPPVRGR